MLVNHPRVAANAVLSPPEEADSPAAHPRPRQGPANKQLDFDLSKEDLKANLAQTAGLMCMCVCVFRARVSSCPFVPIFVHVFFCIVH